MLAHRDRDRRQLGDLVALRRRDSDPLALTEDVRAGRAAVRPVLDQRIHPFERKQRAVLTLVPRLAAPPSARARLPRARWRRRRVLGGRQRRVVRAAVEAPLKLGDPALKPPVGLDQLPDPHQQGDRRLRSPSRIASASARSIAPEFAAQRQVPLPTCKP
jgi:hypothetical protein